MKRPSFLVLNKLRGVGKRAKFGSTLLIWCICHGALADEFSSSTLLSYPKADLLRLGMEVRDAERLLGERIRAKSNNVGEHAFHANDAGQWVGMIFDRKTGRLVAYSGSLIRPLSTAELESLARRSQKRISEVDVRAIAIKVETVFLSHSATTGYCSAPSQISLYSVPPLGAVAGRLNVPGISVVARDWVNARIRGEPFSHSGSAPQSAGTACL